MGEDQTERVPAGHGVPAGDPVGAHPPLQRRHRAIWSTTSAIRYPASRPVIRPALRIMPVETWWACCATTATTRPPRPPTRRAAGGRRGRRRGRMRQHRLTAGGTAAGERGGHGSPWDLALGPEIPRRTPGAFSPCRYCRSRSVARDRRRPARGADRDAAGPPGRPTAGCGIASAGTDTQPAVARPLTCRKMPAPRPRTGRW